MKILHLISGGDSGGAKTHVLSLLEDLSRDNDVTLICFMEGPFSAEARERGVKTRVLGGFLSSLRTLRALVKAERFDVVHCHGSRGNLMGALLRQVYRPADREAMAATLALLQTLCRTVRFYALSCNMDPSAARVAFEGMKR